MRQIGSIPQPDQAQQFCDHLLTLGIRSRGEPTPAGCTIWIIDEGDVARSRAELAEFLAQPDHAKYTEARDSAEAIRRAALARQKQYQKNVVDMRSRWDRPLAAYPRLTLAVAALAIVVGLITFLGNNNRTAALLISNRISRAYLESQHSAGEAVMPRLYLSYVKDDPLWGLVEIRQGQVWRLLSPVFLHFGFPHLLFNLMMWMSFAGLMERRYGWLPLLAFLLVTGVASSLGQYAYSGPGFGGLSGVDYGLFGFVWIRGKLDPTFGARLTPMSVFMALLWFVLCMTGRVGPIANAAHAVGLLGGVAAAYLTLPRR